MSVLQLVHFFCFVAYCYLGVYIGLQNRNALVNRLCVALFFCFSIWSFSMVWLHGPHASLENARFFGNLGAIGWCAFSSLFLWLMAAFTGRYTLLKKRWFYFLILGMPLFFLYKQYTGYILVDFNREWFGWRGVLGTTVWPYIYFIFNLLTMTVGFYFNINFMRQTPNPVIRQQAKIVFSGALVSMVIGTYTDMVCTIFSVYWIPDLADIAALFWAIGVAYAIGRYRFLGVTPVTAADNIISAMFECLLLLSKEGNIIRVNRATVLETGYSESELEGKSVNLLFSLVGLGGERVGGDVLTLGGEMNRELILKTKVGREIPVLFSCSVLKDDLGVMVGIVCVAKDISWLKALERENFQSKKLESVGMLARSLAHDFNNLLSHILGNLLLARQGVNGGDPLYRILNNAEDATRKALDLAVKFNTFSHWEELDKEKITISRLLEKMNPGCLSNLVGESQGAVSYHVQIADNLRLIYGDEAQLVLVLENIFCNTLEAIPRDRDGRIEVRADNDTVGADIKEGNRFLLKKGHYVRLSIRDDGCGIPVENIEKVFDPYFSTKQKTSNKGVGLGLTICYAIIKKHGGHIALESEVGKGTHVSLYLPAVESGRKET